MREPDELLIPHMVIMPVYTNDMYAFVENVTALRRAIKNCLHPHPISKLRIYLYTETNLNILQSFALNFGQL